MDREGGGTQHPSDVSRHLHLIDGSQLADFAEAEANQKVNHANEDRGS
jgi:hypothetical protein